jgi:DNA-binding LytR/AlgR family response regulator
MQKYNCIIVEDEPLAAEILEDYINQIPFLQLKHVCADALFAMEVLQSENIDLVFLDIHLPKLKGIDFIKSLKTPPQIIITTAYDEYALQGFEYNVLDYLLKPIEFTRFLSAVNKLNSNKASTDMMPDKQLNAERESIFFNVSKKMVRIYLDEILYIESLKEYIRVVTASKSIITKFQLGQIEELIPQKHFLRVHRSFIVSKDKIEAYTAMHIEIKGKQIPIGRGYKEAVLKIQGK